MTAAIAADKCFFTGLNTADSFRYGGLPQARRAVNHLEASLRTRKSGFVITPSLATH
jgi:hypothetical protein